MKIEPPEATMLDTVTCAPPAAAVLVKVTVEVPVTFLTPLGNVMVRGLG